MKNNIYSQKHNRIKTKRGQPETPGNMNVKEQESVKTVEKNMLRKRNRRE